MWFSDMDDERIPELDDLPKKPLVEAIFELRWALKKNPAGMERGSGVPRLAWPIL